jgi:hypothetical protein
MYARFDSDPRFHPLNPKPQTPFFLILRMESSGVAHLHNLPFQAGKRGNEYEQTGDDEV